MIRRSRCSRAEASALLESYARSLQPYPFTIHVADDSLASLVHMFHLEYARSSFRRFFARYSTTSQHSAHRIPDAQRCGAQRKSDEDHETERELDDTGQGASGEQGRVAKGADSDGGDVDRCGLGKEKIGYENSAAGHWLGPTRGKLVLYLVSGSLDAAEGAPKEGSSPLGMDRGHKGCAGCQLYGPDADVMLWRGVGEELCGHAECDLECEDVGVHDAWPSDAHVREGDGWVFESRQPACACRAWHAGTCALIFVSLRRCRMLCARSLISSPFTDMARVPAG